MSDQIKNVALKEQLSIVTKELQDHTHKILLKNLIQGCALIEESSRFSATSKDLEIIKLLQNLNARNHPEKENNKIFEELAKNVREAFPENPTDTEILSNSATPDLVRYLVAALKSYDGHPQNLATAFKIRKAGAGTPQEIWSMRKALIEAAEHAIKEIQLLYFSKEENQHISQSTGIKMAVMPKEIRDLMLQAAEDAAYKKFILEKKHKLTQSPKQERESRQAIRELLEKCRQERQTIGNFYNSPTAQN